MLSGYLITGLLWAELAGTGRLRLAAVYARPIRRLLPAAVPVLVGAGSLVLSVQLTRVSQPWAFFSLPTGLGSWRPGAWSRWSPPRARPIAR